jgi:hypothetical protein
MSVSGAKGRLKWIAVVPVIDAASMVAEVKFAKAYGACAVFMCGLIARRLDRANNAAARNLIRDNHVYVACQTDDDLPYVIGSDYGHNDTSSEIEALRTIKTKGEVEPRIIYKDSLRQRQSAVWFIVVPASGFRFYLRRERAPHVAEAVYDALVDTLNPTPVAD